MLDCSFYVSRIALNTSKAVCRMKIFDYCANKFKPLKTLSILLHEAKFHLFTLE
jgi:hypothetical protein